MPPTYLQHPLLRNPAKWLRGVPKRHHPNLVLESYDSAAVASNPFVAALEATRLDQSRAKFPIGNMVQVIVAVSGDSKNLKAMPVLEKPQAGQNPAAYVINSGPYIRFLARKRFSPIPLKIRHRAPSVASSVQVSPDFSDEVEMLYEEAVAGTKMAHVKDQPGLLIKTGERRIEWDGSRPTIYLPFVGQPTFVSFKENNATCLALVKALMFGQT